MSNKASTVRVVDSRIEPQAAPVYAQTVGPIQNQYYKIPASGLSNSYITFNNMSTLGTDRAYLDTFELEITATFHFQCDSGTVGPRFDKWVIDSFPFNKCCDEIRVNINGGSFFSQPLSYLRAKERYWNEYDLAAAYSNVCPCNKPHLQSEIGLNNPGAGAVEDLIKDACSIDRYAQPVRTGQVSKGFNRTAAGVSSSHNNIQVPRYVLAQTNDIRVTWREPIFASPFSSRIDATYGRPLYNITSMDISFNLQDLRNMIRMCDTNVNSYSVNIDDCQLCYQVMTVPSGLAPSMTVVPYRRFVPFVTDYTENPVGGNGYNTNEVTIYSGNYTLNEIPTAIWLFMGPVKSKYQIETDDIYNFGDIATVHRTHAFNKGFGFIKHVNLSLANTTQILNTAEQMDLYRIAKANGCKDSWMEWSKPNPFVQTQTYNTSTQAPHAEIIPVCGGMGSVLRLIPGTDIVLPDKQLIPGTNANNMVFRAEVTADFPSLPINYRNVALWILFEYVGVATITPGQCQITMNPLGDGSVMNTAPVVSAAQMEEPSQMEGSGWLDKLKDVASKALNVVKDTGIVGNALNMVPGVGGVLSNVAKSFGFGSLKRPRYSGGNISVAGGKKMDLDDFC